MVLEVTEVLEDAPGEGCNGVRLRYRGVQPVSLRYGLNTQTSRWISMATLEPSALKAMGTE